MTEDEKKILAKLLEDKERIIAIKKEFGKEYEHLNEKEDKKAYNSTNTLADICKENVYTIEKILSGIENFIACLEDAVDEGVIPEEKILPQKELLYSSFKYLDIIQSANLECKYWLSLEGKDDPEKVVYRAERLLSFVQDFNKMEKVVLYPMNESLRIIKNFSSEKWINEKDIVLLEEFFHKCKGLIYSWQQEWVPALENKITYPFIHSKTDFDDMPILEQHHISEMTDPDITIQNCSGCGKIIPLIAAVCPYCGKKLREKGGYHEEPIACVYAAPNIMNKPERKEGIFSKLFKKKK